MCDSRRQNDSKTETGREPRNKPEVNLVSDANLVGRTITETREMTVAEGEVEGWEFGHHGPPMVLVLDDGTILYPSRDTEGNGPGELFGVQDGKTVMWWGRDE